jgi:hypothetical protein
MATRARRKSDPPPIPGQRVHRPPGRRHRPHRSIGRCTRGLGALTLGSFDRTVVGGITGVGEGSRTCRLLGPLGVDARRERRGRRSLPDRHPIGPGQRARRARAHGPARSDRPQPRLGLRLGDLPLGNGARAPEPVPSPRLRSGPQRAVARALPHRQPGFRGSTRAALPDRARSPRRAAASRTGVGGPCNRSRLGRLRLRPRRRGGPRVVPGGLPGLDPTVAAARGPGAVRRGPCVDDHRRRARLEGAPATDDGYRRAAPPGPAPRAPGAHPSCFAAKRARAARERAPLPVAGRSLESRRPHPRPRQPRGGARRSCPRRSAPPSAARSRASSPAVRRTATRTRSARGRASASCAGT